MTLFDRVKSAADSRGYTLAELSRAAGIGEKSIYAWKPSKNYPEGIHPKKATLQKIADVLGVSVDYLLGNTDEMHPASSSNEEMDSLDLDKALSEHGVARFQGKELSDDYKRAVLAVLNTLNSNDSKE